jgi:uncharacterized membrane protein
MWAVLLGVAATVWVGLLVVAPYLPGYAGAALYGTGSLICHQIAERSFHVAGFQLPVCARCLGLYAGVWLGVIGRLWHGGLPSLDSPRAARTFAALAAVPTAVTWTFEAIGIWTPSNVTRAVAGLPLGVVVGLVVAGTVATLHYDECVPPRPTAPRPPPPSI